MKFLVIFLIAFTLNCDCYNGRHSKVKWDENKKCYSMVIMQLGEIIPHPVFTGCKKENQYLELRGEIYSGMQKDSVSRIMVVRCNKNGEVVENVITIDKTGNFKFRVKRDKKGFLVFKEIDKDNGYKYTIADFK